MTVNRFGRYEIIAELGRGGMATVYRAYDPNFEREVALKVLPASFLHNPDFDFRHRFEREAKTVAALEHPAIVPVYDFGEEEGQPFLVMRFMTGGALSDLIAQEPLSLAEATTILGRIGSALDEAHAQGIVHRDVKPDNILFDQRGDAYLSDFGLVKLTNTDSITALSILGTPAYMSPEQVHGEEKLDGRSDVYAVGVVLFEMLTAQVPYDADTPTRLMMKHVLEPVPNILDTKPDLPQGCAVVVARAMAKEPARRYPSVNEMVASLKRVMAGEPLPPDEALPTPGREATASDILSDALAALIEQPEEDQPAQVAPVHDTPTHTLKGHTGAVWGVAWSPDGAFLASASTDASVIIWDAQSASPARTLSHGERVLAVAWSHDGSKLACGTGDNRVIVWDAGTGQPFYALEGHSELVSSLSWSPDDARLVSASDDGSLVIWDAGTAEALGKLEGHSRRVRSVAWSPDGAAIASGGADRRVIIWDAHTGALLNTLEGHSFRVNGVAWSPDSARLVSGSYDGALIIWDAGSWTPLARLVGHLDSVHDVSLSPDGRLLASAAHDHSVLVWDVQTGAQLARLAGHGDAVRAVAWSAGEPVLASGSNDRLVMLWKLAL